MGSIGLWGLFDAPNRASNERAKLDDLYRAMEIYAKRPFDD